MEPVTIPVRVDTSTMFAAKLSAALGPRRLTQFAVAIALLGTGLAVVLDRGFLATMLAVAVALVVLRLLVMLASSRLDDDARRRFGGTLTLSRDGLAVTGRDGATEQHPWTWLRSARLRPGRLELQLEARGGRAFVSLSLSRLAERGVLEQVAAHLRAAGKLADG